MNLGKRLAPVAQVYAEPVYDVVMDEVMDDEIIDRYWKVLVLHDVAGGIIAEGGGATIEIRGNVKSTARIGARGGSAKIIVHGEVEDGALLHAVGGGAFVDIRGGVK